MRSDIGVPEPGSAVIRMLLVRWATRPNYPGRAVPRLGQQGLEPAVDRIERRADGRLTDVLAHHRGAGEPVGAGAADHRHRDEDGAVTARRGDVDVVDLE